MTSQPKELIRKSGFFSYALFLNIGSFFLPNANLTYYWSYLRIVENPIRYVDNFVGISQAQIHKRAFLFREFIRRHLHKFLAAGLNMFAESGFGFHFHSVRVVGPSIRPWRHFRGRPRLLNLESRPSTSELRLDWDLLPLGPSAYRVSSDSLGLRSFCLFSASPHSSKA